MAALRRTSLVLLMLGVTSPAFSQELRKDGVLKYPGPQGQVAAAMTFAPDGSIVVAYVAGGSDGQGLQEMRWSEVRLLNVASGKYRVLARASTPATIPGIGANHTLHGFTVDGKKLVVSTLDPGGTEHQLILDVAEKEPARANDTKVNPHRLQGMKSAIADIERGLLRIKQVPPPAAPWYGDYLDLLKKECGVETIHVDPATDDALAEMGGYNAVMLAEIEHRHGKGILGKLNERARLNFEAGKNTVPGALKKTEVDAERLKGMKEGLADIAKGIHKIKEFPIQAGLIPAPEWYARYVSIAKKDYGIDLVEIDDHRFPPRPRADMNGYNDIMSAEIEYRHGSGILSRIAELAKKSS